MDVIILAGGLGTRLRSVVSNVPKCMAPVAGKPFLFYLLKYISRFHVNRVILSVGFLREVVYAWLEENKWLFPFEVVCVEEQSPLGTGGGIRLAMSQVLSDSAIVLNGDTFFNVPLDVFFKKHQEHGFEVSLALKMMDDCNRYGVVDYDEKNYKVEAFNEKGIVQGRGLINGGVYAINRNFDFGFRDGEKFSFETDILEKKCGALGCVHGFGYDEYFIDIGIPMDYERAQHELIDFIG